MAAWDENGKPISDTPNRAQSWDENGKPITSQSLTQSVGVPDVPKPPLPPGLTGPKAGEENSVGGAGNEPGLPAIVNQGIHQLGRSVPAFANSFTRGANNLIEGAAKVASPLAISALAMNPEVTVPAMVAGGAAQPVASHVASSYGADPETSELIGNAAGVGVGAGAGRLGSAISDRVASLPSGKTDQLIRALTDFIPYFGKKVNALRDVFTTDPPAPPYRSVPLHGLSRANGNYPTEYGPAPAGGSIVAGNGPPAITQPPTPAPFRSTPLKGLYRATGDTPVEYGSAPKGGSIVAGNGPPPVAGQESGSPRVQPFRSEPLKMRSVPPSVEPGRNISPPSLPTLGTRAEMMRQLRLSQDRPFVDPRESQIIATEPPSVPDTPADYRARVSQSRGKFDANGNRK